jgi:1-acyl-sn-glycerol-3-phosphate acyltransferase
MAEPRLPRRSPRLTVLFTWYARRYLSRHFHAVRLLRECSTLPPPGTPLVVYLNHPSWWDPLVAMVLARALAPGRPGYGPMDATMLERYAIFKRLGLFGVERSAPDARDRFIATSRIVLAQPDAMLWLTPQGAMVDARSRPARLKRGLGDLAATMERGLLVPLALEYPFWTERLPEALAALGTPIDVREHAGQAGAWWSRRLAGALDATMDRLADASVTQDAHAFRTLVGGTSGTGGVYGLWQRLRARARGEPYRAEHLPASGASTAPEQRGVAS